MRRSKEGCMVGGEEGKKCVYSVVTTIRSQKRREAGRI